MTGYEAVYLNAVEWEAFTDSRPDAHILQAARWGALKSHFGWSVERVALRRGGEIIAGAQVLYRRLPFGLGSIAYIPKGPIADWSDREAVSLLLVALDEAAKARGAVLLKVEPDAEDTPRWRARLREMGFVPSPQTVQPPRTILVDISPDEDAILAAMKQKTRYNIRLAFRKGVEVRRGTEADLDDFNRLMQITGRRDGFGVHAPEYYRKAYELFAPVGRIALLMAYYRGRPLAGLMAFAHGKRAWYLYGASSNEERSRMPTYALQWEAIRWARERGCVLYDLWGVPDEDEEVLEAEFTKRRGGLWGVYRFKRGFGGRLVRHLPAWDRVYKRPIYSLYRLLTTYRRDGARR